MSAVALTFKKHVITVERETKRDNWYITVQCPDGTYAYDGWWRDSVDKTVEQAIAEAKHGAQLEKQQ